MINSIKIGSDKGGITIISKSEFINSDCICELKKDICDCNEKKTNKK